MAEVRTAIRRLRDTYRRIWSIAGLVVAIGALVAGVSVYAAGRFVNDHDIVAMELGGGKRTGALVKALLTGARPLSIGKLDATLGWDLALIAGYGTFLIIGARLAMWLVRTERTRMYCLAGLSAAVIAIVSDLLEDLFLALGFHTNHGAGSRWYDAASAASTVKFCALLPAVITAVGGVLLTIYRTAPALGHRKLTIQAADCWAPWPVENIDPFLRANVTNVDTGALERFRRGYNVPPCGPGSHPPQQGDEITGLGLSGGGIRAATLALGALQSPKMREELPKIQYVVSVSGGGYTAGAVVQALTGAGPEPVDAEVVRDPATVFDVGTPEADYFRRHASYLASNPLELLTAIGLLARHLLLTLTVLFGPAIIAGAILGRFYKAVPLTMMTILSPGGVRAAALHISFHTGTWLALAATSGIALLLWLVLQDARNHQRTWLETCERGAVGFTLLTLTIAVVTLAIPGLTWTSSWLLKHASPAVTLGSPILTVLATYGGSLFSFIWRNRSKVTSAAGAGGGAKAVPRSALQILLVIGALILLGASWLILLGGLVRVGLGPTWAASTLAIFWAILAATLFLAVVVDETTLSMHPFYRARLARAFAVRRLRATSGYLVAEPYDPEQQTALHEFGVLEEPTLFPHFIFAASATLGRQRTPPGNNRVSYTMCAHWIGGPEVGYIASAPLHTVSPRRLQRDMTVQGAVAISGAAVASSVSGQGSSWFETFMAISGVRLGAWLPNPRFVMDRYVAQPDTAELGVLRPKTQAGLPHVRRLPYLLRELFGGHSPDGPLVQVTDGGFYDNLGLIELFRRGCTRIYIVDSSGDSPPAATTLAQALAVARTELGIETNLGDETWTTYTEGSATPLDPATPLAALSARLSQTGIIRGTFRYPNCGPSAGKVGLLVVAKAALWPELSYTLLAYAQNNSVFPHDSTADQFFDDGKFTAYTDLGRHLGDEAVAVMTNGPFPIAPA